MIKLITRTAPAALLSVLMVAGPATPVRANTTSTLILIGAAVAAAATAINVNNKNQKANTLIGYLANGDRVYADGHVVTRNGGTYYPGDHGQTLQCQDMRCAIVGTNGMYRGRHVGFQNHHAGGRVLYNQPGPPPNPPGPPANRPGPPNNWNGRHH